MTSDHEKWLNVTHYSTLGDEHFAYMTVKVPYSS